MIAADGNGAFLARRRRVAHIVSLDAFTYLLDRRRPRARGRNCIDSRQMGAHVFSFYALDDIERLNYI